MHYSPQVESRFINVAVYKLVYLFKSPGLMVTLRPKFDVWAFGCMEFDVFQVGNGFRTSSGKPLCLFHFWICLLHGPSSCSGAITA